MGTWKGVLNLKVKMDETKSNITLRSALGTSGEPEDFIYFIKDALMGKMDASVVTRIQRSLKTDRNNTVMVYTHMLISSIKLIKKLW